MLGTQETAKPGQLTTLRGSWSGERPEIRHLTEISYFADRKQHDFIVTLTKEPALN